MQAENQEENKQKEEELQEKIRVQEKIHLKSIQEMQDAKARYEQKLAKRVKSEITVSDWLAEIKVTYTQELDELARRNALTMRFLFSKSQH